MTHASISGRIALVTGGGVASARPPRWRWRAYDCAMNTQLIAVVCAVAAVVLTPVYLTLAFKVLKALAQSRDATRPQ